jgi:glycosyltransferase involved in cell wall biosynthesis
MDVHVVVPDGIDDPQRPSGGNIYDRRLCEELAAVGWSVKEHAVRGSWPTPTRADLTALGEVVGGLPDDAVVLLDGLVASTAPEALVPRARRLRLVVLVHMPLGGAPGMDSDVVRQREGAVLASTAAVVTTSGWTRSLLLDRYPLSPDRVHVAEPGADPAGVAPGTPSGGELLCVAAVTPQKGYDVLLDALARISHLPWRCRCLGSLDRDPAFVDQLRSRARELGVSHRMRTPGPLTGADLEDAYAAADVLVLPSRGETYGMVVTEALAHGLPVVATAVGGLPEALGSAPDGSRPGLLVPPDDSAALAGALRTWLGDADLRQRLRLTAGQRRATLPSWSVTADRVSRALEGVAA